MMLPRVYHTKGPASLSCALRNRIPHRVFYQAFFTQPPKRLLAPGSPSLPPADLLFSSEARETQKRRRLRERAQDARSRRGRARGRRSRVTSPAGRRKGPKVVAFFRPHVSARARQRERERGRKRPEEPRGRRLERVLEMSQRTRGQTDSRGASASRTQRNLFEK